MDKELLFGKTLEFVKKTAKNQGNVISEEQVVTAFAPLHLEEEQMQMVYDYLKKQAIGIGDPLADEEYLSTEEVDYLKEYEESLKAFEDATDGEKQATFLSAMAGDKNARNRLIEIFLPKVPEFARLYSGQGVLIEDLIGQGNMALSEGVNMLNAMENAQEAEGMLVKMMMDAMEELVSETYETQQGDEEMLKKINQIAKQAKDLSEELRRDVTIEELAEETKIPAEEIEEAFRISGFAIEGIEGNKNQ
jgi:RNA polymerase primary sigma factor